MSQVGNRLLGAAGLLLPTLCLFGAGAAAAQDAAPALLGHQAALELDGAGTSISHSPSPSTVPMISGMAKGSLIGPPAPVRAEHRGAA